MISRRVISAGLAVLLLAGLYFALRNSSAGPPPAQPQARAYHLSIEGKRVVSGPELIAATKGDTVTLYVTADRAAMMEIHGCGQEIALEPGERWRFPLPLTVPDASASTSTASTVTSKWRRSRSNRDEASGPRCGRRSPASVLGQLEFRVSTQKRT